MAKVVKVDVVKQLTTSWVNGDGSLDTSTHTWDLPSFPGATPQISYELGVAPYGEPDTDAQVKQIVKMSDQQVAGVRLAFQLWDDLVPFDIVQSPNNNPTSGIIVNYSSGT